ncbi:MAG: hypothetical protein QF662_07965, partial [Phycisphaerae bacterium]|nr:hypothetical protein [Phycisphaerae bacterium]
LDIKLDTNGTNPEAIISLSTSGLIDYVAMDIKAPLDERYEAACGAEVDLDAIRKSIGFLMKGSVEVEFRTTACPAFIDEDEIRLMGSAIRGAPVWALQPFSPAEALDASLRGLSPWLEEKMTELARIGGEYVATCFVRGQEQGKGARCTAGPEHR